MINLEEWRLKSKEKDTVVKKSIDAEVVSESNADDEALIKALEDTAKTIRWKEGKRKEEGEGKGRKPKRRKLERLTIWGEAKIEDESQDIEPNLDVGLGIGNWARVGLEVRLEVGN